MAFLLQTSTPSPSWGLLALMLLMLTAAAGVFWHLTRHWTLGRKLGALGDWAREQGMELHAREPIALPGVLANCGPEPRAMLAIAGKKTWLLQLQTQSAGAVEPPRRWHVLIRLLDAPVPTVGLRPAETQYSLLDLFPVRTFPGLLPPERFVVVANDRAPAEALATSSVRALLPADLGLIVVDDALVIDFSTRAFDGIEFSRLLTIVDQIIPHLPSVS